VSDRNGINPMAPAEAMTICRRVSSAPAQCAYQSLPNGYYSFATRSLLGRYWRD
jgi:hypothetical protein